MKRHLQAFAVVAVAVGAWAPVSAQSAGQAPPAPPGPAAVGTVTPVKIQVVISRYSGDKKLSSMPYSLTANLVNEAPAGAHLRMGARVPVLMITSGASAPAGDGKPIPTVGPIQYQDVGTNIDCEVRPVADGRFLTTLTVDDSSVYPDEQGAQTPTKGNPTFRSFRASDSMVLKDGQSAQFTAATDKVTGETVRVDVTLTVVK